MHLVLLPSFSFLWVTWENTLLSLVHRKESSEVMATKPTSKSLDHPKDFSCRSSYICHRSC